MKRLEFSNFDAFASSVRNVDCRMTAHNTHLHKWSLGIAKAGGVEIQFGQLGSGNILEGQSWREGYVFYLPLTPTTQYISKGETICKDALMVIEPEGDFALSSSGSHEWCSVFVPTDLFDRSTQGVPTSFTTLPDPSLAMGIRQTVGEVLDASGQMDNFATTAAGLRAERVLISICSQLSANQRIDTHAEKRCVDRDDIINKFRAHVRSMDFTDLRVGKLAQTLGVSERTLHAAIRGYFAVSPKRYMEAAVMRHIRHELLRADPDDLSVSAIFAERGIFEFGRFAGRYHQIYGEHPSETLRRSNPHLRPVV